MPIKEKQKGVLGWDYFTEPGNPAELGVRGIGSSPGAAFESAAMGLCGMVMDPSRVRAEKKFELRCGPAGMELLFLEWMNRLIHLMDSESMAFAYFEAELEGQFLRAAAWGQLKNAISQKTAPPPKGALNAGLRVFPMEGGLWCARCLLEL
jgi:SHS2 domain-containing protein